MKAISYREAYILVKDSWEDDEEYCSLGTIIEKKYKIIAGCNLCPLFKERNKICKFIYYGKNDFLKLLVKDNPNILLSKEELQT